jgi:glycosyltransferase involved in cell wall biosynthesis
MLEAMACGTPVAAFPVTGPIDVVTRGVNGVLDEDLGRAVLAALALDREACRRSALTRTWDRASGNSLSHLVRAGRAGTSRRHSRLAPVAVRGRCSETAGAL